MNRLKSLIRGMLSVYSCDFDIFDRIERPKSQLSRFQDSRFLRLSPLKFDTGSIADDCAKVAGDMRQVIDDHRK